MTELDDELLPAVAEIVTDLGKEITVVEDTMVYDPVTGSTAHVTTPHTVLCTPPAGYNQILVDGDIIRMDDLKVLLSAELISFVPKIGWKVIIDGVTWSILHVRPIFSGELVCALGLHLRR